MIKNLINFGISSLKANLYNYTAPLNVMISVTNKCNAKCSYCDIPLRKQKELTTEQIITLFDEIKSLGCQRIALWGGEPLLRDDIGYLIDYAKKKCGFFISIDTNAYLVPKKLKEIKNVDVLVISFDGPQHIHDKNRELGSYNKVIEAFKLVKGKKKVFTITVLTKENIKYIDFILENAVKYGFACTFQVLHHTKELASDNESDFMPENKEYREAIKLLIKRKQEKFPIVSSFPYLKYLLSWKDYKKAVSYEKTKLKCYASKLYANVDTDGSVYPCSVMIGQMDALNYLNVGFEKAFKYSQKVKCKSCDASCFTEYNYMHSFNLEVIFNWLKYTI